MHKFKEIRQLKREPDRWKPWAILCTIVFIGGISETYRILTSDAPDIVNIRTELIIMAFYWEALLLCLSILFWKKSRKSRGY